MKTRDFEYCSCTTRTAITTGFEDDWGYWDVCVDCGKRLEDEYHYYNHYDGEDHEVFYTMDGGIETENDD